LSSFKIMKRDKIRSILELIIVVFFWSVIISIFYTSHSKIISTYSYFGTRIIFGFFIAFIFGLIGFSIFNGYREAIELYKFMISGKKVGLGGKFLLVILLIFTFIIALIFSRW
jgi:hypothetical protein